MDSTIKEEAFALCEQLIDSLSHLRSRKVLPRFIFPFPHNSVPMKPPSRPCLPRFPRSPIWLATPSTTYPVIPSFPCYLTPLSDYSGSGLYKTREEAEDSLKELESEYNNNLSQYHIDEAKLRMVAEKYASYLAEYKCLAEQLADYDKYFPAIQETALTVLSLVTDAEPQLMARFQRMIPDHADSYKSHGLEYYLGQAVVTPIDHDTKQGLFSLIYAAFNYETNSFDVKKCIQADFREIAIQFAKDAHREYKKYCKEIKTLTLVILSEIETPA